MHFKKFLQFRNMNIIDVKMKVAQKCLYFAIYVHCVSFSDPIPTNYTIL